MGASKIGIGPPPLVGFRFATQKGSTILSSDGSNSKTGATPIWLLQGKTCVAISWKYNGLPKTQSKESKRIWKAKPQSGSGSRHKLCRHSSLSATHLGIGTSGRDSRDYTSGQCSPMNFHECLWLFRIWTPCKQVLGFPFGFPFKPTKRGFPPKDT